MDRPAIVSEIADVKNFKFGTIQDFGSILGALYLREFVGETPWAHVDIGETAFREAATDLWASGATGSLTRTLIGYSSKGTTRVIGMSIIDDLVAHPGVYLGIDHDARGSAAAKIVVAALPGGAGVTLDYETFNPANERIRGHAEHAVLGRTSGGGAILVSGHIHADSVTVLRESEPGVFVMGSEPSAFPVEIKISMPEPGRLIHIWSYGAPGEDPVERDRAELTLSS